MIEDAYKEATNGGGDNASILKLGTNALATNYFELLYSDQKTLSSFFFSSTLPAGSLTTEALKIAAGYTDAGDFYIVLKKQIWATVGN